MIGVTNDGDLIEEKRTPNGEVEMLTLQLKHTRYYKIFLSICIFLFIDANIFIKN